MKKTMIMILTLTLFLSLALPAFSEDVLTLNFWVRTNDEFATEIADFESQNPTIKINQVQVGENNDDLVVKYNTTIASNSLPHLGIVGQRHGIPQFYDADKLVPIEQYMTEEEQKDVIDGFWTRYTYQNLRLVVPF